MDGDTEEASQIEEEEAKKKMHFSSPSHIAAVFGKSGKFRDSKKPLL